MQPRCNRDTQFDARAGAHRSAAVGRVGAYQRWYEQQELPEVVAPCVRELLNAYKVTVASAKGLRSALLRLSGEEPYGPVVQALEAQPGMGKFTAIRLVLELGDIRRIATLGARLPVGPTKPMWNKASPTDLNPRRRRADRQTLRASWKSPW